ncbi:MAG: hypothetical protein K0S55_1316 [Clostridia bacterium]|jgi:CxxC motif-containing protein|nr:hypothetical protein [Clostridia bacterium]
METKTITCVTCPIGCDIEVDIENNKISEIRNNKCKRGYTYASAEVLNPVRILTSTIKFGKDSSIKKRLAVKSNIPVPKTMLLDCMQIIKKTEVNKSVKMGDVIISNILNTGADIIATRSME